jgi:hypothetical protein
MFRPAGARPKTNLPPATNTEAGPEAHLGPAPVPSLSGSARVRKEAQGNTPENGHGRPHRPAQTPASRDPDAASEMAGEERPR